MAFKLAHDTVVSKPGPLTTVHFRNLLKWKKTANGHESYGARIVLSSVANPKAYSILSFTYSPRDPFWVSLCKAFGVAPADRDFRKALQGSLMSIDALTIRDLNDHSKAEVVALPKSDAEHPGPVYIDMLSEGQRKFLGNCTYVAFRRAGSTDDLPKPERTITTLDLEDI